MEPPLHRESDRPRRTATIRRIFDHYVKLNNWDDAYALAETAELPELIIPLVEESMDDVLAAGRIASLATWSEFARTSRLHAPALDLADAEIAFRRGLHGRSEALAGEAARCFEERHPLYARARLRGGQAAYFNDRHRQALESFTVNVILQRTGTKLHTNYIPSFLNDVDKKSPMIFDNVAWVLYCSKLRHNPEFICCVPRFAIGTREF